VWVAGFFAVILTECAMLSAFSLTDDRTGRYFRATGGGS
jgi:hypothetical protein